MKEGCITLLRTKHAWKIVRPHPLPLNHTLFDRVGERFLALPVNRSIFD